MEKIATYIKAIIKFIEDVLSALTGEDVTLGIELPF